MIIGDPYRFSVCVRVVEERNLDDAFGNGLLFFWVDGVFFPKEKVYTPLKYEIPVLRERLMNPAVDKELYEMPGEMAFAGLCELTFPQDPTAVGDGTFDISPDIFLEMGYMVFAVSNGRRVRILAARAKRIPGGPKRGLSGIGMSEANLSVRELKEIASQLQI